MPEWTEHFDRKYEQEYWHNELTGETTWVRPAALSREEPPAKRPRTAPPASRGESEWDEFFDDFGFKQKYWHNRVTGESRWTPPEGASTAKIDAGTGSLTEVRQLARTSTTVPLDAERVNATVVEWHPDKGYGFVAEDGGSRAFIHRRFLGACREENLEAGERVTCIMKPDERNPDKLSAHRIHRGCLATVTDWDAEKGFGFVLFKHDNCKAFVHRRFLAVGGESRQENLKLGEEVTATLAPDPKTPGKFCAAAVQRLYDPCASSAATRNPLAPPPPAALSL